MAIESKLGVEDSQPDAGADGADGAKVSDAKVAGAGLFSEFQYRPCLLCAFLSPHFPV